MAASGQTRVWLTGPGPSAPGSPVGAVLRLVTYAGHKRAGPRVGPGVLPRRATHCGGLRRRWWLLQVHPCPERATSSSQNTLALLFSPNFITLRRAWLRSVLSVLMLTPTLAEIRGQDLRPQMPAREDSDGWALGAQHPLATPCSQGVRRPHVCCWGSRRVAMWTGHRGLLPWALVTPWAGLALAHAGSLGLQGALASSGDDLDLPTDFSSFPVSSSLKHCVLRRASQVTSNPVWNKGTPQKPRKTRSREDCTAPPAYTPQGGRVTASVGTCGATGQ